MQNLSLDLVEENCHDSRYVITGFEILKIRKYGAFIDSIYSVLCNII